MFKTSVSRTFKFDAAHKLPHYDGKCQNLHGHSWKIQVKVLGKVQTEGPKQGMIVDFSDLKDTVNRVVLGDLDHHYLNDFLDNPTAENLAREVALRLDEEFQKNSYSYELESVRVYESEDSYAEVEYLD